MRSFITGTGDVDTFFRVCSFFYLMRLYVKFNLLINIHSEHNTFGMGYTFILRISILFPKCDYVSPFSWKPILLNKVYRHIYMYVGLMKTLWFMERICFSLVRHHSIFGNLIQNHWWTIYDTTFGYNNQLPIELNWAANFFKTQTEIAKKLFPTITAWKKKLFPWDADVTIFVSLIVMSYMHLTNIIITRPFGAWISFPFISAYEDKKRNFFFLFFFFF